MRTTQKKKDRPRSFSGAVDFADMVGTISRDEWANNAGQAPRFRETSAEPSSRLGHTLSSNYTLSVRPCVVMTTISCFFSPQNPEKNYTIAPILLATYRTTRFGALHCKHEKVTTIFCACIHIVFRILFHSTISR